MPTVVGKSSVNSSIPRRGEILEILVSFTVRRRGHLHYGALAGFYFDHPEIVPDGVQGDFRFNRNDEAASRFASNETEVRAVVEGQMMAKRIHAEQMGFRVCE